MGIPTIAKGQTQVVVLQPTPFCNINCHYCYLPNRSLTQKMQPTTLARICESLFSSSLLAPEITIVWHVGEPLVMPLSFYEQAWQIIAQFNTQKVQVNMALQTNGMLINQQWCDFIKQHTIHISVSLDGPQFLHDRERVDRRGTGTFERTMRGIQLLQENGIEPAIIMVLTKHALAYPEEIWHFFQKHHLLNLAFNVEEINGIHTQSSLASGDDLQSYKQFLKRFLELRDTCERPPFIRDVDPQVDRIGMLEQPTIGQENTPLAILSFDSEGNITTFASELLTMSHPRYKNFWLGNVFEGTLEEILDNQKFDEINTEIQKGVARCKACCPYFTFCGGGSPVNKLSENGTFDSTETMQCKLRIQATMDVVLEQLEQAYDLA